MSGLRSRRKGHGFERAIAIRLREIFPEARRGLQYRDGAEACDVEGTPFHVECKRMKKVSVKAAFEQAVRDSNGRTPVLIYKEDRGEEMVVLRFSDFLKLLKER